MAQVKAAVFGARGFIGRHLIDHLTSAGWEVLALGRGDDRWRGADLGHVFYCAGLTADFRARPFDAIEAHVSFAVELLRHGRFDSFLYCSSTRVYAGAAVGVETADLTVNPAEPGDLYNLSKLMGEAACLTIARPEVRVARLSNVFGHDPQSDNFLNALIRDALTTGRIVLRSDPRSAKDYIAVEDVAVGLARIAVVGSERLYNVAAGVDTATTDILRALQALTGCDVITGAAAPLIGFPPIDVARLRALDCTSGRAVVDAMPNLVARMREFVVKQ